MIKSKKGFTLVELLAVIVILALIMSIAVVSMGGIMQSARESTFRQSAAQIIEGVRTQLTANFETVKNGNAYFNSKVAYVFDKKILDKEVDAPLGGEYNFATITKSSEGTPAETVYKDAAGKYYSYVGSEGSGVYRQLTAKGGTHQKSLTCDKNSISFVNVQYVNGNFVYSICLTTTTDYYFKDVLETSLLDNTAAVSNT